MKRENKRRVLAGVIAVQLVLQAAALQMNVFAEDTAETTPAVTEEATETAESTAAEETTEATAEAAAEETTEATAETAAEETEAVTEAVSLTKDAAETPKAEANTDTITLTGAGTIPETLKEGKLVNIKGTLTSAESNLTAVTVAVYDQAMKRVTGSAAQPQAKTYDLSRLDDFVYFDQLKPGKYIYQVIASNASVTNLVVQEAVFTVVGENETPAANTEDTLTASGVTEIPATMKQGAVLSIKGTVTSAVTDLTTLTCGVYNADGTFVTGRTTNPKAKTYDLQKLDALVAFDKLEPGEYLFAVMASNGAKTNAALVTQKFTVEAAQAPAETSDKLTVADAASIPDSIRQGTSVHISGTVTSEASDMTALTAGVYNVANGAFLTGKTVNPKAKSFDLSKLDQYLTFQALPEGNYLFAVIASNAENTNETLLGKKFTVTAAVSATAPADALTISGGTNVPATLTAGQALAVTGTVTSASSNMTALTVGVYDANGAFKTGKTINPKAKTYDLKNLDRYVEFNKLAAGDYTYAVIASNATNTNYALVSKKFTVGSGSSNNAASDKLTISGGTVVPATLAVGKALNVTGVVTSASSNITALTVGVYDSAGNFKTGKTVNPKAKTYDLKNLDRYVEFNKLTAGTYTYAVIASNAANSNYALVSKSFTVGSGSSSNSGNTADGLTISGGTVIPDTIAVGKALSVYGTVTSASSNMTALTVGVYNASGAFVTGKTINPNAKTYDLHKLDAYVAFNILPAGTYTYAVIASNAANTNYTLVSKKFTVGNGSAAAADGITISGGTVVPATLTQGKGVIVKGTLSSASSNLTSVTVGVYDASGKQVTGGSATPNAKTYNVGNLDSQVLFNKLAAGTYTYRVIASNAANSGYTVVSQSFTVK